MTCGEYTPPQQPESSTDVSRGTAGAAETDTTFHVKHVPWQSAEPHKSFIHICLGGCAYHAIRRTVCHGCLFGTIAI